MAKGEPGEDNTPGEGAEEPGSTTPEVTFASLGVCSELQDACKDLKWSKPTGIQAESIPYLIEGTPCRECARMCTRVCQNSNSRLL